MQVTTLLRKHSLQSVKNPEADQRKRYSFSFFYIYIIILHINVTNIVLHYCFVSELKCKHQSSTADRILHLEPLLPDHHLKVYIMHLMEKDALHVALVLLNISASMHLFFYCHFGSFARFLWIRKGPITCQEIWESQPQQRSQVRNASYDTYYLIHTYNSKLCHIESMSQFLWVLSQQTPYWHYTNHSGSLCECECWLFLSVSLVLMALSALTCPFPTTPRWAVSVSSLKACP